MKSSSADFSDFRISQSPPPPMYVTHHSTWHLRSIFLKNLIASYPGARATDTGALSHLANVKNLKKSSRKHHS